MPRFSLCLVAPMLPSVARLGPSAAPACCASAFADAMRAAAAAMSGDDASPSSTSVSSCASPKLAHQRSRGQDASVAGSEALLGSDFGARMTGALPMRAIGAHAAAASTRGRKRPTRIAS